MAIFLKIPGTPGSSQAKDHLNEFELESFQWSVRRATTATTSDGVRHATFPEYMGTTTDGKSAGLFLLSMNGRACTMTVTFTGKDSAPFLRLTLEGALIVSLSAHSNLVSFAINAASERIETMQSPQATQVLSPVQGKAGVKPPAAGATPAGKSKP